MESLHARSEVGPVGLLSSTTLSARVQRSVEVVVVTLCVEILSSTAVETSHPAVCVRLCSISPSLFKS